MAKRGHCTTAENAGNRFTQEFPGNDKGEINVIRPGKTFDRVAKYELGEPCYASPAISDGQVFLRGFKHLFCIGKPTK